MTDTPQPQETRQEWYGLSHLREIIDSRTIGGGDIAVLEDAYIALSSSPREPQEDETHASQPHPETPQGEEARADAIDTVKEALADARKEIQGQSWREFIGAGRQTCEVVPTGAAVSALDDFADAVLSLLRASQPPPEALQTESWAVTVERNGERIVTISPRELAGRDLSSEDEQVIEQAARHLLSFIGQPPPEALRADKVIVQLEDAHAILNCSPSIDRDEATRVYNAVVAALALLRALSASPAPHTERTT